MHTYVQYIYTYILKNIHTYIVLYKNCYFYFPIYLEFGRYCCSVAVGAGANAPQVHTRKVQQSFPKLWKEWSCVIWRTRVLEKHEEWKVYARSIWKVPVKSRSRQISTMKSTWLVRLMIINVTPKTNYNLQTLMNVLYVVKYNIIYKILKFSHSLPSAIILFSRCATPYFLSSDFWLVQKNVDNKKQFVHCGLLSPTSFIFVVQHCGKYL